MKPTNKHAAAVFEAIIKTIPEGQADTKLDERPGAYMALHVECIGENRYGKLYSFAHYYEQNGDLMRDPDIVMIRAEVLNPFPDQPRIVRFFPISYRQDGLGIDREYVIFEETGYRIARKQQADLASFCGQWAKNIVDQQGIRIENGKVIFTAKEHAA